MTSWLLLPINIKWWIKIDDSSPVISEESEGDFHRPNKRPAPKSKAQWEPWHITTEKIYELIQQQHEIHHNLRYGEFITEMCLTSGNVYSNTDTAYFMDLWNQLSEQDKDSYYRQEG